MIKVKQFDFPTFEEWCNKKYHYIIKNGKYEVEIVKFFSYFAVFTNFPCLHIPWFSVNKIEQKTKLSVWYNNACNIVNTEFEKYIKSYLIEE